MQKWEYMSSGMKITKDINTEIAEELRNFDEYGAKGWEFVSCIQTPSEGIVSSIYLIFKRPLEE